VERVASRIDAGPVAGELSARTTWVDADVRGSGVGGLQWDFDAPCGAASQPRRGPQGHDEVLHLLHVISLPR
jgi:hypothetical protein